MQSDCKSPVALILFNRPEVTERVFAAIRAARPPVLFLIADGPRPNVPSDVARCAAAREVVEKVDWSCQVWRKFAESNLGLRRNVSEGLDWVFAETEEAIVLEDDCLPDPSFFPFCDELLERYHDDANVGMICGTNLAPREIAADDGASYYFSRYCYIWGWATWRRAWQCYDREMKEWPSLGKNDWLKEKVATSTAINFWRRHFDDGFEQHPDGLNTWDIQLVFAFWRHQMRSIVPRENLVRNLGIGADATHTKQPRRRAEQSNGFLKFPLQHPARQAADEKADRHMQAKVFEALTPWQRIYWKLQLPFPIWTVRRTRRWLGNALGAK
jgi:hypothetical protein